MYRLILKMLFGRAALFGLRPVLPISPPGYPLTVHQGSPVCRPVSVRCVRSLRCIRSADRQVFRAEPEFPAVPPSVSGLPAELMLQKASASVLGPARYSGRYSAWSEDRIPHKYSVTASQLERARRPVFAADADLSDCCGHFKFLFRKAFVDSFHDFLPQSSVEIPVALPESPPVYPVQMAAV